VWRVRDRWGNIIELTDERWAYMRNMSDELMLGYDREADVLYLSFGEPKKGMEYIELGDYVILRVHPETRKIVGVTVTDFARRFSSPALPVKLSVTGKFALAGTLP
jgi:uncharacterized protein YuzE